jgi:hypothetical protein
MSCCHRVGCGSLQCCAWDVLYWVQLLLYAN